MRMLLSVRGFLRAMLVRVVDAGQEDQMTEWLSWVCRGARAVQEGQRSEGGRGWSSDARDRWVKAT
jgi:hypothetical protein